MDRIIARKPAWRRHAPLAFAGIVAVAAGGWMVRGTGETTYRVPVNQLKMASTVDGKFEDFIAVRGGIVPFTTAFLTTEQGGTVTRVLVEDGAMVKANQPLIILSNPALQVQVASQQLAFEQARLRNERELLEIEHELTRLKAVLARDKALLDAKMLAPLTYQAEVDEYEYYLKVRAAAVASHAVEQRVRETLLTGANADGSQPIANAGIDALTIRAPMDGQLTALDAEVGQSKSNGSVLGQVNSANRFKLTAHVDEFYLGRIALGQTALLAANGTDYRARIAKVYPQVTNGTFKVDLYFEGPAPTSVQVGQAIDMKVQLGDATNALLLANGPFFQDTGGTWAFVVAPDGGHAVKRPIRLGRRNPQYIEVLEGLAPGEQVIVSAYGAYQTMDRVEFDAPEPSTN